MRCPYCFTRFSLEDYLEHKEAHAKFNDVHKQFVYEFKTYFQSRTRHRPDEPCNCRAYGVLDYCEMLHLEAA